ncbi:hypothetical protein GCM10011487_19310 [Steroidobacter agaridevorans]|uniref:DUF885 domain-containing protein n=1 Tax=Steroidobacter agaridevorans TaxID=2695856 RepID=A0A829YAG0_9GAMM|nr:DUF885 family protein [Steroidobacter agaridevorans]GFE79931.1 hypothetical protein GCM10011487_19310 [Steroidobacter agaridevorans]
MTTLRRLIACALLAAMPAAAGIADTLNDVIAEYETLARATDTNEGPGWPDVSLAAARQRQEKYSELRDRLGKVAAPSGEDALTRELLQWRLQVLIDGARFDEDRIPFDSGDGFFNAGTYAAQVTRIANDADAMAWIARLQALPSYYEGQIANMRRGIATRFTQPRSTAESALRSMQVAADQPAADTPLLKPLVSLPATIPEKRQQDLRALALAVVEREVKPAQRALVTFFEKEYLPKARPKLGASTLPDGNAYYEFAVRRSTTTDLTPDEVFDIGAAEVERIRAEMLSAQRADGFQGTLREYLDDLNRRPGSHAPDIESYVDKAAGIGNRVALELPRWFKTLPRLPWGVRIKPPELEAASGAYNLGDPEKGVAGAVVVGSQAYRSSVYGLTAWMLHEGIPGHHLQIALGQERLDLPKFRRRDDVTAFVEGWALYAERLGAEMGIYRTREERVNQLSMEMWRACRLVMDVGIHWKHWSAEQAAACLQDNTALSPGSVAGETQRYISWPGQALAYKIGEIRIRKIRGEAEQALGSRFDIREFHDALIGSGPMPLDILERRMRRWAQEQMHKS